MYMQYLDLLLSEDAAEWTETTADAVRLLDINNITKRDGHIIRLAIEAEIPRKRP